MATAKSIRPLTVILVLVVIVLSYYAYKMYATEGFTASAGATDADLYFVYATWCPHCKGVLPAMKELSEKSPIDVDGKKVNVVLVESEEKDAIRALPVKIEGFPTFFLKKTDGSVHEYNGERSAPALLEFVKEAL
jgi:thiol-disulfide isomerase/thioredoxin